ncbi:hypothetical protein B0H19DRAFT_1274338 [Mycena capillaripes]|nr:hypothetical protein B0H19DRAFT_1274338 [Mycena capillaripes]
MPFNIPSFSAQDYVKCEKYATALKLYINARGPNPGPTPSGYREVFVLKNPYAPIPEDFEGAATARRAERASRAAGPDIVMTTEALHTFANLIREGRSAGFMPAPIYHVHNHGNHRGPVACTTRPEFNHARNANRSLADRIKRQNNDRGMGTRAARRRRNRLNKKRNVPINVETRSDTSSTGLTTIIEEIDLVDSVAQKDAPEFDEQVEAQIEAQADAILAEDNWNPQEDDGMNMDMANH